MIYFIFTCLAVYILLAGAECTAHYFGRLKQPWTRLRFFVGSIGAIILAVSTAGWAGLIPVSADLPVSRGVAEVPLQDPPMRPADILNGVDLLNEASLRILPEEESASPLVKTSLPKKSNNDGKLKGRDNLEEKPEILWYIHQYSTLHGIDPLLVQAVIRVESGFNPRARSHKGAMGLMQINKVTAKHLGLKDPYNVRENIEGGTRYLKTLLKSHYWNVRLALASYNAGPGMVARYKGIPPFRETRRYVWKVLSEYRKLKLVSKVFKENDDGSTRAENVPSSTTQKKATRASFSPSNTDRFKLYN